VRRFLFVMIVGLLFGLLAGCDEKNGENADGIVGPSIDVHCAGLARQGLGDTTVKVTCPPQSP
jgi:hypothetical protein